MDWSEELKTAAAAAGLASQLCQKVQRALAGQSLEKKDRSPVTVADFGSQALVGQVLRERFPADPLIAEEDSAELRRPESAEIAGRVVEQVSAFHPGCTFDQVASAIDHGVADRYSPRFWTLDPIDGTKGFLRGEQYAVALALIVEGEVTVAALACPNLPHALAEGEGGSLFLAVRGAGARALPLTAAGGLSIDAAAAWSQGTPVRVRSLANAAAAIVCESVESGHSKHDTSAEVVQRLQIGTTPVRLDSQAKYAVVARGQADIYLRLPTDANYREKIWDHAAGCLAIAEAGGRVTDVAGRPLQFTHGRQLEANRGVVATNGLLHDQVLKVLQELGVQ